MMTPTVQGALASDAAQDAHRPVQVAVDRAVRMVSWPSVSGSVGEAEFADRLRALLLEIPYLRSNPGNITLIGSLGDPGTRSVAALVRGSGRKTIVLAGHYDTVSIENYHDVKHLACDVHGLKEALIAQLSSRPRSLQEEQALNDLAGGDFLPGRGLLDMKSGLSVGIACLEGFASDPGREGNVLFVATPDEERESRGMRSLRDALPGLAADLGIDIEAAINLDVTSDQGDGSEGRAVYAGTIGKLLPFVMLIGCSSHASYPFEGVSAQAMAAGILSHFEGNADLADHDETDTSPPPICLEAKDLRDSYEVTTPERVWLAFNWLYHAATAPALFERFHREVWMGASDAIKRFGANARIFSERTGRRIAPPPSAPRSLTFAELRAQAARAVGDGFASLYAEKEREFSDINNPLVVSRLLTTWLVDVAKLSGPALVVGFAGLHYPPSRLHPTRPEDVALKQAIEAVRTEAGAEPSAAMTWKPYFYGISDMSFLGQATSSDDAVAANTPITSLIDRPPPDALSFPIVNIGPWGRDFHQKLERVHAPYAFEILPRTISRIVETFLKS